MQSFIVNSTTLEDKINQLLPSQGGKGAGVDLSASTQIIPIVDLTQSAEGSNLPFALQTALAYGSTTFEVTNGTTDVGNTPGFYRVSGGASVIGSGAATQEASIIISDGLSAKAVWSLKEIVNGNNLNQSLNVDYMVYLRPGDTLQIKADSQCKFTGSVRQVADNQGNLVNPSGFSV